MSKTIEEIRALLGKQVKVTIAYPYVSAPAEVIDGKLLSFDEGGGFVLLDDMGFKHYCWPLLEIDELAAS